MKTVLTCIILAFVIALFGCDTGNSPSGTQPEASNTRPIVCLGDSLTEGYGATVQGVVDLSKSYPAFLQEKLSVSVINAGISGDTAAGGLLRLDHDVLDKNPQVVIILLGANDFMSMPPRPVADTKADLQAIINKLKHITRKIYLASFIGDSDLEADMLETILNEGGIPENMRDTLAPILSASLSGYKDMFTELYSENGDIGSIPDIWAGIKREDHMSDPIHPNAAGYEIMAGNIFNAIKPYLEEKDLLK